MVGWVGMWEGGLAGLEGWSFILLIWLLNIKSMQNDFVNFYDMKNFKYTLQFY